jgi:Right handed beta helix region
MTLSRGHGRRRLGQPVGLALLLLAAGCSRSGTTDEDVSPAPASVGATTAATVPAATTATTGAAAGTTRSFPDASTTGPDPAIELQPSESIEVDEDRAVVENLHVSGAVVVNADDVTIRNVVIDATERYGIQVDPETSGTVIEDVRIVGGLADGLCNIGIVYGDFQARRVDISGCGDGIRAGNNTVLEDSWIHDMRDLPDDHSDGVQAIGGTNIVLRGNNIQMDRAMTSAMILHGHVSGDLRDVIVEDNLLAGGGYSLNIKERTASVRNVVVRDNVWVRDSYNFGPQQGDALADPSITTWEGNVFDDGAPNLLDRPG